MTSPLDYLLLSVLLYVGGGLLSLLFARTERLAVQIATWTGILGGLAGLLAVIPVLLSGQGQAFATAGPFSFAHFMVRLDLLAALMVGVISLLMLITSIYALSYTQEYFGRGAWAMGFFMNVFVASMTALVVCDNALYFLVFFEAMSLASYFLVIFDQSDEAVSAGFLYFLIAHAGSVLILIAFFILYSQSGSLDFASFRELHLSGPLASAVFLLAFFGFGAKAGMVPLHGWLPRAHPAAPSHASAMMSGVMVKIGIFGIIKVGVDLLGATSLWWGLLVLVIGAISAVLGVLYALAEHDIKRLLAWHTVENIGIILLGVGVGMVGMATGHPVWAAVGLLAGLYHLVNHAVFKGLLFLGAGAVLHRTHTRDMEHLGGLAKLMPYTALAFLIGSMAICALPAFNGFASEWFTYQALFSMSRDTSLVLRMAGPLAMVMLAITGGLAVMCFVKTWGVMFSGLPRSSHAAAATEVPWPMVMAMLLLALLCIVLGVGSVYVAPVLATVAASLVGGGAPLVAQGALVLPGDAAQATVSLPLLLVLLVLIPLVPLLLITVAKGTRMARRHAGDAWACGYAQEASMVVSSEGFTQPLRVMFAPLYALREQLDPSRPLHRSLQGSINAATRAEPFWDQYIVMPIVHGVQRLSVLVKRLQHGDYRFYCLYVVAALVILLLLTIQ